jgi:hypothetical protein
MPLLARKETEGLFVYTGGGGEIMDIPKSTQICIRNRKRNKEKRKLRDHDVKWTMMEGMRWMNVLKQT